MKRASSELKSLAQTFDNQFHDASVLIHNGTGRNTLLISISGKDTDKVAKRALAIERAVQQEFERRGNNDSSYFETYEPRSTVEVATGKDSDTAHYDVLVAINEH